MTRTAAHTHAQEENYSPVFLALDKIFLTLFVMEILVKWYHDFFGFWRVGWNVFDFIIVAASLLGPGEFSFDVLKIYRQLESLQVMSHPALRLCHFSFMFVFAHNAWAINGS